MGRLERWGIKAEQEKNIVEIETQHGLYQIIYGVHEIEQSPEVINNSEGLIVEAVGNYSTPAEVQQLLETIQTIPQHQKLLTYCQTEQKSLYLVDLNTAVMRNEVLRAEFKASMETKGAMVLGAWSALLPMASKLKDPTHTITRRGLLAGAIGLSAATYLGSNGIGEVIAHAQGQPEEGSVLRSVDRKVIAANERMHPEIHEIILTYRNYLISQKAEYIAQQRHLLTGSKPKLSILIGAAHVGIESALRLDEEDRLKFIAKIVKKDPNLKQSSIVQVDFDHGDVNTTFMKDETIEKL